MKRLGELANQVGGKLIGRPDQSITDAASIDLVQPGEITFALDEQRLERFLAGPAAAAVVPQSLVLDTVTLDGKSLICCQHPEQAFAQIVALFRPPISRPQVGISPQAHISPTARIAEDVTIYPGVFIDDDVTIECGTIIFPNVTILAGSSVGKHVRIFPNAVLYENSIVGDRCLIHGGAVIGGYGFGYKTEQGRHQLSSQLGNVVIESDVEIGANSTIDRGTYESTVIGEGTKIDNLVMIAHNCQIGRFNLLCSQVGIAGSSRTGDYVVMGGQVGIGDHLTIGDRVMICAQSGVMHDLGGQRTYAGAPAVPARESMQQHALVAKLPEMRKKLKQLEKQLAMYQATPQMLHTSGATDEPSEPDRRAA